MTVVAIPPCRKSSLLATAAAGAGGYTVLSNGMVASITVTNAGSGYISVPTVQIDPPNGLLLGQTNATLNLTAITTNQAGSYFVVVSNASGSVTSSVAALNLAAAIAMQPQSLAVWAGQPANFAVLGDTAGPYTYQWQFNGTNIIGATNSAYPLNSVATNDAGSYTVVLSNQYSGILSASAALTVNYISQQPADQLVTDGGATAFNVGVSGIGPFRYQWQFNGSNISDAPIITTVAGNGTNGYSGDGGAANTAMLNYPVSVAVDSVGNLYIADCANQRIRKVGTNGIITTVVGNGTNGYSGDGDLATSATLNYPYGVVVDTLGNLLIADGENHCIRKVGTNGIITTVVGNGTNGYSGDGGLATNAMLSSSLGIAVDTAGNFFIADGDNNRIRKVGTNGIITTVAGNGTHGHSGDGGSSTNACLYYPSAVVVDNAGNLFIADQFNQRIRKVGTNGIITTVAGNGTNGYSGDGGMATSAMLLNPNGVFVDAADNIFIADRSNQRIRKVGTNGIITTVVGNGTNGYSGDGDLATSARLNYPYGVVVDTLGNLLIAEILNHCVRKTFKPSTTGFFKIRSINTNHIGTYRVIIASSSGSVTSSMASLVMVYQPTITQPPQGLSIAAGSDAFFSVSANGTGPLCYQWWKVSETQSNATASPVVINGFVLGANLTSGGTGYLSAPQLQVVGGSGTGAGGYAVVSNRMVSAITITNAGSGYTTSPTIQIDAPSAMSLFGQTSPTLILPAVSGDSAANYFVVVTNNYGCVTSAMAALAVMPAGYNQITGQFVDGTNLQLGFVGIAGTNYALDRSFSLSPPNWIPQVTNPADASGRLVFTNLPVPTTNNFWRVRSAP